MELVYEHPKTGKKIYSNVPIPKDGSKDYIYFMELIPTGKPYVKKVRRRHVKVGTTGQAPLDRFKQHLNSKTYAPYDIVITWISRAYAYLTTLRVEMNMKEKWKLFPDWDYKRNDQFIIPGNVEEITIRVRKDYIIRI